MALVTPVNEVALSPVYVNISEFICIVPLLLNPAVLTTVTVPEPVIAVPEAIFISNSEEAELNILSPLAANTKLLNLVDSKTDSAAKFVKGTS